LEAYKTEIKMEEIATDAIGIFYTEVVLEILNSVVLFTVAYHIYKGIEVRHPVYALIFGDILVALASSLTNVLVFPFVKTYRYTSLSKGNNIFCLFFHCCSWSVLSVLRYMYIINKNWLEQTFPDPSSLRKVSFLALFILITINVLTFFATTMYFGYPGVKVMKTISLYVLPRANKLKCLFFASCMSLMSLFFMICFVTAITILL
jgi:hypothetical protein